MRSNFYWTANRMTAAWLFGMVASAGAFGALAEAARLPPAVLGVPALLGSAVLIIPLLRILARQVDGVAAHASVQRPHGVVIPASALTLSSDTGRELGLQTAGLNASGGSPVALVVLPDRVEVWSGRNESEPRWSADAADLTATVGLVRVGLANKWDVVRLTDGTTTLAVSPRYGTLPLDAGGDIDRVLAELGLDPSAVRRASSTASPEP
ncbi:hypothetical protein ACFQHV_00745 [Promicromonospora thailandica]|uniref:Uncharacterized protein n=1 Tax=Promicromonospora thailandica TaxID=765201 RepID=A0A9X2FZ68_9MICO|nr:hypothetical protein [Promicromonospora thailandica]MCP2262733.1 hypothetical protein [Promicromonospora thailandica]BFF18057.1 hypothetical protein GCM10025730_15780 [Promicromonospora thailandica]